jgi:Cation transporter/ATPase, N-terminus
MPIIQHPAENLASYALSSEDVAAQLGVDSDEGLTVAEADQRLAEYGPNELS